MIISQEPEATLFEKFPTLDLKTVIELFPNVATGNQSSHCQICFDLYGTPEICFHEQIHQNFYNMICSNGL